MVLYPEILRHESANIDQAEQVCRIGLDLPGQVTGLIDQQVLRDGFCACWVVQTQKLFAQDIRTLVVPVSNRENGFLVVLVGVIAVVFALVNNEEAAEAVLVLAQSMGMVPKRAMLVGDGEIVEHGVIGADGALRQEGNTVHGVRAGLEHAVHVQRGVRAVLEAVGEEDLDAVSALYAHGRPRELTVTGDDGAFLEPVEVRGAPRGGPVELVCRGARRARERQRERKDESELERYQLLQHSFSSLRTSLPGRAAPAWPRQSSALAYIPCTVLPRTRSSRPARYRYLCNRLSS